MGSTKIDLVKDLNEKAFKTVDPKKGYAIKIMAQRAAMGYYHDFESELAYPKIQLHLDLLEFGFTDLDTKLQKGEYDNESPSSEADRKLEAMIHEEIR